jgi:uncharacterized protein (TIGR02300 family)
MSRPELGHKFACVGCGARFYDLNRSPAICPKCEIQQPAEKPRVVRAVGGGASSRRSGWNRLPPAVHEEPEAAEVVEDAEAEADENEQEDEPDNDVDELPDVGESAL